MNTQESTGRQDVVGVQHFRKIYEPYDAVVNCLALALCWEHWQQSQAHSKLFCMCLLRIALVQ